MPVVAASSRAAEEVQAHEVVAQGEAPQQIWVRAVGNHDSRSVMVSLKAPTGDTELNGLGFGRLYSPQVGTLDPEKSFAAQGISKGATLSLLPRLNIGGVGGSPEDEKQETLAQSTTTGQMLSDADAARTQSQSCANTLAGSEPTFYVAQKWLANAEDAATSHDHARKQDERTTKVQPLFTCTQPQSSTRIPTFCPKPLPFTHGPPPSAPSLVHLLHNSGG